MAERGKGRVPRRLRQGRETLELAQSLLPPEARDKEVDDLAFLAMACHRLGDQEQTRKFLAKMRALRDEARDAKAQAEFANLLQEAEQLVEGR